MVNQMNRQERSSSMMRDIVSIIEVGCGVVWDEIKEVSGMVMSVFKNDNKSIEREESWGHDQGGSYRYDDMIYRNSSTSGTPGCHTPGNVKNSNDSNQNENNTNVQDEDGVDENDWRDRFSGWLP